MRADWQRVSQRESRMMREHDPTCPTRLAASAPSARFNRCAALLVAAVLWGLMGSSCPNMLRQYKMPAIAQPARQAASFEQISAIVNDKSDRVAKLFQSAKMTSPHFP